METLIGVFLSPASAERAIHELLQIPVPHDAITFLTAGPDTVDGSKAGGKAMGAFLGGIFGGTAGLSLGAAAATLLVPGVGPVLAIGIGAAALLGLGGAGAGAALGNSKTQAVASQPEVPCASSADAQFFRTVLSKGNSLVIVRTESKLLAEAACVVLDRLGTGTRREGLSASATKAAVRQVNGVAIVELSGRIMLDEGGAILRDTVSQLLEQGHRSIMLNLARVTHMDSSGLGELVRALTSVRSRGGQLKLVHVSLPVSELLRITCLVSLFEVAQNEPGGAGSFSASAP